MSTTLMVQFLDGSRIGQSLRFDLKETPKILCGTDEEAQVHFSSNRHPQVSRRHLAVVLDRSTGEVELVDSSVEGSYANGSSLRKHRLSGDIEVELGKGGPKLRFSVEKTQRSAPVAGSPSAVSSAKATGESSRRASKPMLAGIGVLAAILLVVALIALMRGSRDSAIDDQRVEARVAETQRAMEQKLQATVRSLEAEMAKTKQQVNRSLIDVDESVGNARAKAELAEEQARKARGDAQRFIEAARKYEKAVALVSSGATAFAIAPRVLATNAHVSEKNPDYVYLNRGKGRKLSVIRSVRHPRYDERDSPGGMYDVALLYVNEDMPVFFPIAESSVLEGVDSGYPVAYLGFPSEGLKGGGVVTRAPVATMKTGIVTTVSDFWLAEASFTDSKLLRHNLGTAGGASGSPIFNREGQVVAIHNAGNYAHKVNGRRVQSGAVISFAQRIDCLREIWENYPD